MKNYKAWTKDELKEFVKLWESVSSAELAQRFGVTKATISAIAARFRRAGFPLVMKRRNGHLDELISEAIREIKRR